MESKITELVFEYDKEGDHPVVDMDGSIEQPFQELIIQMVWGGFFGNGTIFIDKFLREDLSINLEKLELAVILAVRYLESKTAFHEPIFIQIGGIEKYYELRGIQDKPLNKKEEYYFIRGFMQAVAENESYKKAYVEYKADDSKILRV